MYMCMYKKKKRKNIVSFYNVYIFSNDMQKTKILPRVENTLIEYAEEE